MSSVAICSSNLYLDFLNTVAHESSYKVYDDACMCYVYKNRVATESEWIVDVILTPLACTSAFIVVIDCCGPFII